MRRKGALYVVGTPIGNLSDLSARAIETLASVDFVLAEDTRRTGRLLAHHGIKNRLGSLHKFNEAEQLDRLLDRLTGGERLALVSDGGTPVVSDPGHRLIDGAHRRDVPVIPIPGASSVIAALSASGFTADSFYFAGFLPSRAAERRRRIGQLATVRDSIVLFESPHRLLASLEDLSDIVGDRSAAVCRELTKLHEEIARGSLRELLESFASREKILGEITIVIDGGSARPRSVDPADAGLRADYLAALDLEDGDSRRALRRLSRDTGWPRSQLKRRLDAVADGRREEGQRARQQPRVLFLCTGNACRSQMAEGFARELHGTWLESYSAGLEPQGLDPRAVLVMAECGIDISGQSSKHMDELADARFDLVITVCAAAEAACPAYPEALAQRHVEFDDPPRLAARESSEERALAHYRRVRDEIRQLVAGFAPDELSGRGDPVT